MVLLASSDSCEFTVLTYTDATEKNRRTAIRRCTEGKDLGRIPSHEVKGVSIPLPIVARHIHATTFRTGGRVYPMHMKSQHALQNTLLSDLPSSHLGPIRETLGTRKNAGIPCCQCKKPWKISAQRNLYLPASRDFSPRTVRKPYSPFDLRRHRHACAPPGPHLSYGPPRSEI
jgi:hypothetical protein